jgi:hypothetical protein
MRKILLAFTLSLVAAMPATARQLMLSFDNGRVSMEADAVPARTILSEWARLGGTKVIGGERITGTPLTIKLVDVPESQALDIVLRSVAGYMAAPRSVAATGASMYDRILVMATSTVPVAPAARATPAGRGASAGTQRFVAPRRQVEADDEEPEEEEDLNPPNPPVFTFPQPGQQNGFTQPGMFQNAPVGVGGPAVTVNPSNGGAQTITINPAPGSAQPVYAPAVGAPTPGMISQPPPPPPGQIVRPPGV